MKKILSLICFLIILFGNLSADNSSLNFRFTTSYESNILHLSENDIDQFLADTYSAYSGQYKLKSVDDLIYSFRVNLNYKNYLVGGHTQIDKITFGYDKYQKNGFNDFKFISLQIDQYLNKYFKCFAKYYYYPNIYINQYKSELESSDEYRELAYSKDKYVSGGKLSIPNLFRFEYSFEFAQSYHNQYFTYYNADIFNNSFSVEFFPLKNFKIKAKYSYKFSLTDIFVQAGQEVMDASYNSDIYFLSLNFPLNMLGLRTRFIYSWEFEDKYYQSNLPIEIDEFHKNRNDQIIDHNIILKYSVFENITLRGLYEFKQRKTYSPKEIVKREKNYTAYSWGLGISLNF
ncbi:MAG: hypothetical protein U9P79_03370 [Candidatus Cloacimonadota bacterium]|nr:hypothetical protein [Candidatus Cloacimonadota bacterium]